MPTQEEMKDKEKCCKKCWFSDSASYGCLNGSCKCHTTESEGKVDHSHVCKESCPLFPPQPSDLAK